MSKDVKFPAGTWVERDLFESKAFIALGGIAPQLLIFFLSKRQFITDGRDGKKKRVCTNYDNLSFTYKEARQKYDLTCPRFTRGIDELLAKGFITIKHQGGAYRHDKTVYGLSENWKNWLHSMVIERRQIDPVQRGYRKPKRKSNA